MIPRLVFDGVTSRRGIMCSHREVPYQRAEPYDLSWSEWAQDRHVILPLYPAMTDDDLHYVVDSLRSAVTGPC